MNEKAMSNRPVLHSGHVNVNCDNSNTVHVGIAHIIISQIQCRKVVFSLWLSDKIS